MANIHRSAPQPRLPWNTVHREETRVGIGSNIGKALLAQAPDMAPGAAVSLLRGILGFAIDGASGLPGVRQAAGKTLTKHDGDVEQAINSLVNQHLSLIHI